MARLVTRSCTRPSRARHIEPSWPSYQRHAGTAVKRPSCSRRRSKTPSQMAMQGPNTTGKP